MEDILFAGKKAKGAEGCLQYIVLPPMDMKVSLIYIPEEIIPCRFPLENLWQTKN